ncbi:MAG TPA: adenylate/guanylate cyclase domain-containing protein [Acidimicrobiales bacterium]|nr:adenylate/guanylate cyclase domain-containing protein [Acidimicrobiales bacterium]
MGKGADISDDDLVALGLCAADKLHTSRPAFIRMLLERGATLDEVRIAAAGGQHYLSALASEFVFFPPGNLTVNDVARDADVTVDEVVEIFRSLGLTDPRLAGARLTDRDVDLVRFIIGARALVGAENVLDIARAFGTAIAQMSETSVTALRRGFEQPQRGGEGSELAIQRGYDVFPTVVVPDLVRSIETVFLRGVVTSLYSEIAVNDGAAVQSDRTLVFVDLVDFTAFARRTETAQLSRIIAAFENAAVDEAVKHGGRVVKLLGDGAMFVFNHRADGIAAAVGMVRDHGDILPSRAGVATGRVVTRTGDYFGPVVNLASRLSGAVDAGEVAVDDSQAVEGGERMSALALKGIEEPVTYYRLG